MLSNWIGLDRITRALHSCGAVSPGKDASFMYIAEAFSASEETE